MFPSYDPLSLFILEGDEVTLLAERRRRAEERAESESSAIDERRSARWHLLPPLPPRHV